MDKGVIGDFFRKWSLIYKFKKQENWYTSICECTVEIP